MKRDSSVSFSVRARVSVSVWSHQQGGTWRQHQQVALLTTPNGDERLRHVREDPLVVVQVDDEVLRLVAVRNSVLLQRVWERSGSAGYSDTAEPPTELDLAVELEPDLGVHG